MRHVPGKTNWLCSELVTLRFDQVAENKAIPANLEQVSPSSVILLSDIPVPCGCQLSILVQGQELRGEVSDQSFDAVLGWYLTIELDEATQWSPEWFTPEHLICVESVNQVAATAA